MSLPASGPISMSMVNTELGYSSTATISLNDAAVRTLFAKSSGVISLSDGYGKSNVIMTATGGTITTNGDYKTHTFDSSGTFTVTYKAASGYTLNVEIYGGGQDGGAGSTGNNSDGGSTGGQGGDGGYRSNPYINSALDLDSNFTTNTGYAVTIGAASTNSSVAKIGGTLSSNGLTGTPGTGGSGGAGVGGNSNDSSGAGGGGGGDAPSQSGGNGGVSNADGGGGGSGGNSALYGSGGNGNTGENGAVFGAGGGGGGGGGGTMEGPSQDAYGGNGGQGGLAASGGVIITYKYK